MSARLDGKVAIVTGGASGIGAAIAVAYAAEGASVVVADINTTGGEAVVKEIKGNGGKAKFIATDMKDREQVKAMAAAAEKEYGKIDILTNSVGIMFSKPFLECTEDDWWNVMDTNVLTHVFAMWEVIPYMQKQGKGSIVNVSSKLGTNRPNNQEAFYTFASAALTMVSRSAQMDMAKEGIRINVLAPGMTNTEAVKKIESWKKFEDPLVIPMGRFADPEEIANAAVFLASDESSYVSGLMLEVDGGWVGGEHMTATDC